MASVGFNKIHQLVWFSIYIPVQIQTPFSNIQLETCSYIAAVWHRLILIKFIRKFDLYVSYQDIFLFRNQITLMNQ